jgi:beta-N-acetylhexosaminidase
MVRIQHHKKKINILILVFVIICGFIVIFSIYSQVTSNIPSTSASLTPTKNQNVQLEISRMNLHEKILSIMLFHTPGIDPNTVKAFISQYHPAGVILMDDNITNDIEQVRKLTKAIQNASSPYPSLIAVDEEGCSVKRIPSDYFPCANQLKDLPLKNTYTAFRDRSILLHDLGMNVNFGIIADITGNENSFIYPRVFGSDSNKVSDYVTTAIQGSQPYVFSTLKHFPGHGGTSEDSHNTIPENSMSKDDWLKSDYVPFKSGVQANSEFVMFGHLNFKNIDNNPASLSSKWHTILQKEVGFSGIMITDDMIMLQNSQDPQYKNMVKNAIQAMNAGNNILLYVNEYNLENEPVKHIDIDNLINGIESAVNSGEIDMNKFNESVFKVLEIRSRL